MDKEKDTVSSIVSLPTGWSAAIVDRPSQVADRIVEEVRLAGGPVGPLIRHPAPELSLEDNTHWSDPAYDHAKFTVSMPTAAWATDQLRLIAISSDGPGSGKSTLAKKLGGEVFSLANSIRDDLTITYPRYDWYNRTQEYKASTYVVECGGKSLRDVMIEYGQGACLRDPTIWVRKCADAIVDRHSSNLICVDDLRKVIELEYLRHKFPGQVLHIHLETAGVPPEPQYENERLKQMADYVMKWKR